MMQFTVHPNIYSTGQFNGLRNILENTWVRNHNSGDGTFYIVSGFANYNGGARFYKTFTEHTENGGRIIAFLGGKSSQRLSSKQVVEALLDCGVEVNVINRKRILHAKCYGSDTSSGQRLVVSSGNFTGPGMSQNIEASLFLDTTETSNMNFSWIEFTDNMQNQDWQIHQPSLGQLRDPAWNLLYDETPGLVRLEESEKVTMVLVLGHSDTARILASPGSSAAKGTQYFWLSKDNFDFFPPLTIRNRRGYKGTLSTIINLKYVDLDELDTTCRVTFEAENNLDFRLGTGRLKYTRLAKQGDLACLSRTGESDYELRIIGREIESYDAISRYAIHFIGHRGKRYGFIDNSDFENILNIKLGN